MDHLLKAFKIIESHKEAADFEEPKSEKLIKYAEEVLGINFPPTYRCFLMQYGCGDIEGLEIYGIIDEDFETPGIPDGIWLTLDERKTGGLPSHFIIISSTGDGYWYCLDASQPNSEGEYPVVIWGLGIPENKKEKVAEDFGEFLLNELTNALEDENEEVAPPA